MDVVLFAAAFVLGIYLRFVNDLNMAVGAQWQYYPSVLWGGLVFATACYIFGLYAPQIFNQSLFTRALLLLLNLGLSILLMSAMFYLNFSSRVGRGVMIYGAFFSFLFVLAHHAWILRQLKGFKERVALVLTDAEDELESSLFLNCWSGHLELVGIIHREGYRPKTSARLLGPTSRLVELTVENQIERVLCTTRSMGDPDLYQSFCQLRYMGETVMPLVNLCEDVYQMVPVELVTSQWLMNASDSPHMLYIKKAKRGFDIVSAMAGLLFLGPVMLGAAVIIKLTSRGPVFYRQTRAGRFGRPFQVIKLRSMRVDAEQGKAVWAKTNDDRATWFGKIMRRYRIDEIPQLLNVLRGEMSFVGPRPERPEFVEELAQQIPYFKERLMIQPGLTGWAQVNYPYGASVEDARHKLEYDLYYMKHMSVFLDMFILVDTIRIVLRGGLDDQAKQQVPFCRNAATATDSPAPMADRAPRPGVATPTP